MKSIPLPLGCRAFGEASLDSDSLRRLAPWINRQNDLTFLLVLGGSCTAEVEGISAAGSTPSSRRYTAIADAELLLRGPSGKREFSLPPLVAGVSPALISYVATNLIGLKPLLLAVGLEEDPVFPHLRIEAPELGPAKCISTGKAMDHNRVASLWEKGLIIGRSLKNPLILAECVPGGTTTAQGVLTAMGLSVSDLISGSALNPPILLKKKLIEKGLSIAGLGANPSPTKIIAAMGDPFQPVAAGILLGAREAGQPVLLGGGSQMIAVLALALSTLKPSRRKDFASDVAIATTSWLLQERVSKDHLKSSLETLLDHVGEFFKVKLLGYASGLRFSSSSYKALRDYEKGYVKEGVGAGALALLAQLRGASLDELLHLCDKEMSNFPEEIYSC